MNKLVQCRVNKNYYFNFSDWFTCSHIAQYLVPCVRCFGSVMLLVYDFAWWHLSLYKKYLWFSNINLLNTLSHIKNDHLAKKYLQRAFIYKKYNLCKNINNYPMSLAGFGAFLLVLTVEKQSRLMWISLSVIFYLYYYWSSLCLLVIFIFIFIGFLYHYR